MVSVYAKVRFFFYLQMKNKYKHTINVQCTNRLFHIKYGFVTVTNFTRLANHCIKRHFMSMIRSLKDRHFI